MMELVRDLEAAQKKLHHVNHTISGFKQAVRTMECFKKWGKEGKVWKPSFNLTENHSLYSNDIEIQVEVPYGVIQQQLANAINAWRRELVKLGVNPDAIEAYT